MNFFFPLEIIFRETKHGRCYYFSRCRFLSWINSQCWRCPGSLGSLPGSSKPQPMSWARHGHLHQSYRFWEIFLGQWYLKVFIHMKSVFTNFLLQKCIDTDIYFVRLLCNVVSAMILHLQCQLPPSSTQSELQEWHGPLCSHCGRPATANIMGVPQL